MTDTPEAVEAALMDAALFGAGFLRVHPDGRKELLYPASVYVKPSATADAAFLARILAHA